MNRKYVIGKHYHRLVPCPSYDIAEIETWLSDMAEEGLLLSDDGIFAGIADFEYQGPSEVKYRLEAAQKNNGMWSDNGGNPDDEQIELSEKYSWKYVAKLKDFYIYRSMNPEARELNTDPEVQALAINAVKKRARGSVISALIVLFIYPLVLTRGCLLLSAIAIGSVWLLAALILCVILLVNEIRAFVHLRRLQRSLQEEGYYDSEKDWRKEKTPFLLRKLATAILGIFFVFILLKTWGESVTGSDKIPLSEYTGTIPFATIKDFAGEGFSGYTYTMTGMLRGINVIEEKNDIIVPKCIEYNEYAQVSRADGSLMDCCLYVDYCELLNPFMAKVCAKELYRLDKVRKHASKTKAPELPADYVIAYTDNSHFPSVIIVKDNIVIKAYVCQFSSSDYKMSVQEWAQIVYDMMQ